MVESVDLGCLFCREAEAHFGFLRDLGYALPLLTTRNSKVLGRSFKVAWQPPRLDVRLMLAVGANSIESPGARRQLLLPVAAGLIVAAHRTHTGQ
jgi:hypothetical protein